MSNYQDDKEALAERLKKRLEKRIDDVGFKVIDADNLFKGLQELYVKPSVEEVIEQELPLILKADPRFFLRNQIYVGNVSERLADLYGAGTPAYNRVGEHALPDAIYSFKVNFRHIYFFMSNHPDKKELRHVVDGIQRILRGGYIDEFRTEERNTGEVIIEATFMDAHSIPIPNILNIPEKSYHYFESFEGVYDAVSRALPFIKEPEARRVATKIHSQKGCPSEKASYTKRTIESYLHEARSVVANKDKPIPNYYDTNSTVYQSIIKPARDAILV